MISADVDNALRARWTRKAPAHHGEHNTKRR
jgi:hypothetical protein